MVVRALNSDIPLWRSEMRRLVQEWEGSKRDARRLFERCPELKPYLYRPNRAPLWYAIPVPIGSGIQVMLMPQGSNVPTTKEECLRDEMRLMFMNFLINPLRESLSVGPCERCDKYFLTKTQHRKIYCSRKCGAFATAKLATQRHRAARHKALLETAQEAIAEWAKRPRREDWKTFVVRRINEKHKTVITAKSLSRWVKAGKLQGPPQKGGNT